MSDMTHTPASRSAELHRRFDLARLALGEANRLLLAGNLHTAESHRLLLDGLRACDLSRPLEG